MDEDGKDVDTNLEKLISGRGRVLVHYDLALMHEYNNSPKKQLLKVVGKGLMPYTHHMVFSKKMNEKTVEKITTSIRLLKESKEWQTVLDQYMLTH